MRAVGAHFSIAPGTFPNLAGTVPEILGPAGHVLNPIPGDDDRKTAAGARFLGLGVAAGLTDWAEVGLSMHRGLHSTFRLAEWRRWALSVSPAYFRATRDGDGGSLLESDDQIWTRVANLNVTTLVAYEAVTRPRGAVDFYGGVGINRYEVRIRDQWRSHVGHAPSAATGVTVDLRNAGTNRRGLHRTARVSLETTGAWLTQRDDTRSLVLDLRVLVALGDSR